ncbi:hypothetical protein RJ639_000492 [Escallonia herrerae]|uniref:alcohol dehydrogenase n=1 Tax=Escallonia herrerae TaxID=1293975 RepID=A0AA88XJM5_9ASTE|nr:hypothetical protein RJ639_000492 [Escallonia herrerae]
MSSTVGQVILCKAAVAWEAGKPLVIEEVEVAPPQKMGVHLKILFTSLCHTNVYFWEAMGQNPVLPGYLNYVIMYCGECWGRCDRSSIRGHLLPVFIGECKECAHCKLEESNMCDLLRINTDTVTRVGCVAKINPPAPLDKVCVLSCGISTAKKFGVTEFVNPKECKKPVQEVIAEMTDGGIDRSVECNVNIDATISAFECGHDGWVVDVLVGVLHKDAVFKTHPVNLLNERTLKGTFFGNYKPRSDLPSVVEKYKDNVGFVCPTLAYMC